MPVVFRKAQKEEKEQPPFPLQGPCICFHRDIRKSRRLDEIPNTLSPWSMQEFVPNLLPPSKVWGLCRCNSRVEVQEENLPLRCIFQVFALLEVFHKPIRPCGMHKKLPEKGKEMCRLLHNMNFDRGGECDGPLWKEGC